MSAQSSKKQISCLFFKSGTCRNGDSCTFLHENVSTTRTSLNDISSLWSNTKRLSTGPMNTTSNARSTEPFQDSRAKVPCRFFSSPGGCQKGSCPYLHVVQELDRATDGIRSLEIAEIEASYEMMS